MISAVDAITNLNDCGCCEGISAETPLTVTNRPGLSAVVYRAGTQAEFKETLIARLSGSNQPALRALTTRDDDDFTIALLDAWATVGDVLTFYQERLANESYLRTATERLSVLELARLTGRQQNPRQRHAECAGAANDVAQPAFLHDEREPEQERAEALAQQPFEPSAARELLAREAPLPELAQPSLPASVALESDPDGRARRRRRKAEQSPHEAGEHPTAGGDAGIARHAGA